MMMMMSLLPFTQIAHESISGQQSRRQISDFIGTVIQNDTISTKSTHLRDGEQGGRRNHTSLGKATVVYFVISIANR